MGEAERRLVEKWGERFETSDDRGREYAKKGEAPAALAVDAAQV